MTDLDISKLQISDNTQPGATEVPSTSSTSEAPKETLATDNVPTNESTASSPTTEKKKPYINPERVATGGSQRDKLTEEELSERMARIK